MKKNYILSSIILLSYCLSTNFIFASQQNNLGKGYIDFYKNSRMYRFLNIENISGTVFFEENLDEDSDKKIGCIDQLNTKIINSFKKEINDEINDEINSEERLRKTLLIENFKISYFSNQECDEKDEINNYNELFDNKIDENSKERIYFTINEKSEQTTDDSSDSSDSSDGEQSYDNQSGGEEHNLLNNKLRKFLTQNKIGTLLLKYKKTSITLIVFAIIIVGYMVVRKQEEIDQENAEKEEIINYIFQD